MKSTIEIKESLVEDTIVFLTWVAAAEENPESIRSAAQALLNSYHTEGGIKHG